MIAKNALKHGLLSKEVLLETESPKQFRILAASLKTDLAPEGPLEELLADKVILAAWRMQRFYQLEKATLTNSKILPPEKQEASEWVQGEPDCEMTDSERAAMAKALEEQILAAAKEPHPWHFETHLRAEPAGDDPPPLQLLARYGGALDREFYRALHELQRLQAIRKGSQVVAPMALDVDVSITPEEA